jgi:KDO2-lipid IV(A) lauroyltransferase
MTSVAERLEPAALFDYFVEQRAAMGLTIVPLGSKSGGAILSTLRAGGLVGLLCDRDIEGTGVEVEFFGERTTMPGGPATLALRTGARLCTGAVYSGPGRDHRALVEAPLDTTRSGSLRADVARLTQEIATRLEGLIRRAPEQWHVFQPLWLADRPTIGEAA